MTTPVTPTYTCYDPDSSSQEDGEVSTTLLDVIEDFGIILNTPGSLSTVKPYVAAGQVDVAQTNFPFQGLGGVAPTFVTQNGLGARRFAPGTNQTCIAYSMFGMPLKRDLSLIPASVRRQYIHTWDTVLARATPLIAGVKCTIGLQDDGVEFTTAGGGIVLSSQSTENAGRWTLKYYLINGGAIQTGADSGVVPDGTPQHFQFKYHDVYPSPYLEISINGVLKYTVSGALLPVFDGNEPLNYCICSGGAVNTIGQLEHNFYNRFMVELA
jgi:hypothetical protein